jgi:glyoxylase-like metal-dependent hydrolase (beta-lactamase superfamily II)
MPAPEQVADRIERLATRTPTLPPATHTNSYALGGREVLLVEPATPYKDEQRDWLQWAEGLRSQGRTLVGIFVTHHHVDHIGGATELSKALGLQLWGHADTAARLPNVRFDRLLVDGESLVLEGPALQRWSVLHTPGHAAGHLCLLEREAGHVIVGDMVASQGTILIEPGDGDMTLYLEQLARLEDLNATCALPAHGAPIDQPSKLFRTYIRHRGMRETKILSALRTFGERGATPKSLVPIAYDDAPKQVWPMAVLSVRAHIEKLVRDGRVAEVDGRYVATEVA